MASVLIVDDDRFTRTVLQTVFAQDEAFSNLDLKVYTADNGEQGLGAFRAHRPDVVIADLLMPRMDGFTMTRTIRADPRGKDTHIVAMSAIYRDTAVADKLKKELDIEFFAKPYQLRDLAHYVAALLKSGGKRVKRKPTQAEQPATAEASDGDLAKRPLPAVLFDLLDAKASGQLTLTRGRITKVVELMVGHPLSVSSTARDEALGHLLVTFGVITEEQHKRAVKRAAETKQRVADALISLGVLTPEAMVAQLTMQTCYRLIQALRWPDGMWRFVPSSAALAGPRGNPIDMVALVLQGLKQTASVDSIPERMAAFESGALSLTRRGTALLPAVRQYLSPQFADTFRPGIKVSALLRAGIDRNELYVTLDALVSCDALTVPEGGVQPDDSGASAEFSVEDLSHHSTVVRRKTNQSQGGRDGELYSMLFGDVGTMASQSIGDLPIELPDEDEDDDPRYKVDSGVIDVAGMRRGDGPVDEDETNHARRVLLKEYLRIQGTDHYAVLKVQRGAAAPEVSAALAERKSKFSFDWFARYDLGRDYAKLEEIHAAYDQAFQVLIDDDKRTRYDRTLLGEESHASPEPVLAAEISFHAGQDLLLHGSYEGAIEKLEEAVKAAPDEAHYHTALGWAHYLKGGRSLHAADAARPHLNQALAINPDHALTHEYKGIINAEQGTDDAESIFHLERALEIDGSRAQALKVLEMIFTRRGEFRPLEQQYRKQIYRAAGTEPARELDLWLKLAELYRIRLNEPKNARIAYESAARLAPNDPRVQAALTETEAGVVDRFVVQAKELRKAWRADPMSAEPGIQLMQAAQGAGRPDAAFMTASALVARGVADRDAEGFYQRFRPRFVIRAHRRFDREIWQELRHAQDRPELDRLFELIGPAVNAEFPLSFLDLEVDESMEVAEGDLPETFVRIRAYVANMLGVQAPRVFVRTDFGRQVHIGAVSPPVVLAGDEALMSPERAELAFRLGRCMTYLLPGRSFAGSRPSRLLKAAVLALMATIYPETKVEDPDGHLAAIQKAFLTLPVEAFAEAQALVSKLMGSGRALNLSQWARALGRTADRVGLILCGDLPAAVRYARDSSGAEAIDDLIDFAVSAACWTVRYQLGLSIDV